MKFSEHLQMAVVGLEKWKEQAATKTNRCICLTGDPCDYHAATCITCPPRHDSRGILLPFRCQGHPELNEVESFHFFQEDSRFNCEKVLAQAKADGLIFNYDDGRDRDPWFNYYRGVDVSELRDVFLKAGYTINTDY